MTEMGFRSSLEPCAILQADGWEATLPAFEAELSRLLGGQLPAAVGESAVLGSWLAIRIAPRRLWVVGDTTSPDLAAIDPELGCLVTLSESRMRLRLEGRHTFDILAACVAVDWKAKEAWPGRAIQTSFHHVPVLLLPIAADACDLLVPRTFADSLAGWVAEGAAP